MASHATTTETGLWETLTGAWARYRKRRAAVAELQALGDTELERLVQDAGLTFGDVLALAKQNASSAAMLYRRLEQVGIDLKSIDPNMLRDMQRCCSFCDSKARCEHDLDHRPKAANWPDYCPNQQTIEALTLIKHH